MFSSIALRTTSAEVEARNLSIIRFRYHLMVSAFKSISLAMSLVFAPRAMRRTMPSSCGVKTIGLVSSVVISNCSLILCYVNFAQLYQKNTTQKGGFPPLKGGEMSDFLMFFDKTGCINVKFVS